jgi:hypothetical protein
MLSQFANVCCGVVYLGIVRVNEAKCTFASANMVYGLDRVMCGCNCLRHNGIHLPVIFFLFI